MTDGWNFFDSSVMPQGKDKEMVAYAADSLLSTRMMLKLRLRIRIGRWVILMKALYAWNLV